MWTIGKLSEAAKVTQRTIRYYEELELLKPLSRGDNRFRYYDESHVARLEAIRVLKDSGLGLKDISLAVSPILDSRGKPIPAGREIALKIRDVLLGKKQNLSEIEKRSALAEGIELLLNDLKVCLSCNEEAFKVDCGTCQKGPTVITEWAYPLAQPAKELN
ncbi:MAG TPA: MerR family transcriptional regulator [Bdellovibrionota bacterium]|jgi:DNA-binding transcriptional MerR regulator|nr:MerR family transcriptional regulator [Bdellovibrionota bacterium]